MSTKNVLIISHFFPPCNKVGGRRWAKFAKILAHKYNVFVLSVHVPYQGVCPWENDIVSFKSQITKIPFIEHRPYYKVNKTPHHFFDKIKYHLSWNYEKFIKKNKVQKLDVDSYLYRNSLLQNAKKIINKNSISTVIITGGPFEWCYNAMELKKSFPQINFLLDLRDYWTFGIVYKTLSVAQQKLEDDKEAYCIANASVVFTPADRIKLYLKQKYNLYKNKMVLLPHAYDKDELPNITFAPSKTKNNNHFVFTYGGMLYSSMQESIYKLIELLQFLIGEGKTVQVDLYSFNTNYINLFETAGLAQYVNYHAAINPKKLFEILLQSDYLLQLRAGEMEEQHFKSTKFYELIALKKPILYIGPNGDVEDFLVDNNLGFTANQPIDRLAKIIIANKKEAQIPDLSFYVEDYELTTVTKTLEAYIK